MPDKPIKTAATQPEPPTRRWAVLALLGVAQLMVVLDVTIVNVALLSAQRALGFSTDSRQWVVTAYAGDRRARERRQIRQRAHLQAAPPSFCQLLEDEEVARVDFVLTLQVSRHVSNRRPHVYSK